MKVRVQDPRLTAGAVAADVIAAKEAEAFAADELDKVKARKNFERTERFQDHLISAVIFIFWAGVVALGATGLTWFYHLLTPPCWHFLDSNQLDKVEAVLFSGMVSASLSGIAKKYLS